MPDTQSIDPVKLEWRSYGAHYKCDVNINEVVGLSIVLCN